MILTVFAAMLIASRGVTALTFAIAIAGLIEAIAELGYI
jgi:hypothetical protein